MRVAIITESFAPDLNGVANSVVKVVEQLARRGHEPMVIAPQPSPTAGRPIARENSSRFHEHDHGYPVVRVRSVPVPGYRSFRVGLPSARVLEALDRFAPDIVHLASPFVLGAYGIAAADRLDLPSVAVYQTDVPRYAAGYGLGFASAAGWRWLRAIHNRADRTLAPSSAAVRDLVEHGIERVHLWRRGVDTSRFHPRYRDPALRAKFATTGVLAGYVGRLAREKHLELLEPVARLPGVTLLIVGNGPLRDPLERLLPGAVFLGELNGHDLARVYASLDVFVHPGPMRRSVRQFRKHWRAAYP